MDRQFSGVLPCTGRTKADAVKGTVKAVTDSEVFMDGSERRTRNARVGGSVYWRENIQRWMAAVIMPDGKRVARSARTREQAEELRAQLLREGGINPPQKPQEPDTASLFRPCWLYFVESTANGLIKIGIANDVDTRFSVLCSGSPVPLVLRASVHAKVLDEVRLHTRFKDSRSHGEWFRPVPPLLAIVEFAEVNGRLPYTKTELPDLLANAV